MPSTFPELDPYRPGNDNPAPSTLPEAQTWLDQQMREDRDQQIREGLIQAPSPDVVARTTRLARQTGQLPVTVEGNEDAVEKGQQAQAMAGLAQQHPAVGAWAAANPRGAAAAADDTKNLGLLATAWDTIKKLPERMVGAGGLDLADMAVSTAAAVDDLWSNISTAPGQLYNWVTGNKKGQELYSQLMANQQTDHAAAVASVRNAADRIRAKNQGANYVSEQVLQGSEMVPMVVGAALTGDPLVGGAMVGSGVGGQAYETARSKGMSGAAAAAYGVVQGTVMGAAQMLPLGELLKVPGRSLASGFARYMVKDQLAMMGATAASTFTDWALLPENKDKTFGDWVHSLPEAEASTVLQNIALGGLVYGAKVGSDAVGKGADYFAQRVQAARDAKTGTAFLDQAAKSAETSKLRQRDPEAFRDLMQRQAEEAGTTDAFIPGEAIRQYRQSDSYDAQSDPFDPARWNVDEAAATGGDIVVPIHDLLTDVVGTPAWDVIKDDVRLTPGGMSNKEAQAFQDNLDQTLASLSEDQAQQGKGEVDSQTARQKIADKVASMFGESFTAPVARQLGELVAQRAQTRAARLGVDLQGNELDNLDVKQVMPETVAPFVKADELDRVIHAMRQRKPVEEGVGPSLLDFIKQRGGINDRGDLRSMGVDPKLLRDTSQGGMLGGVSGAGDFGLDSTLRSAIEAGYFPHLNTLESEPGPSQLDTNALIEAIGRELAGNPVHTETRTDHVRAAAEDLRAMLEDSGLSPDKMSDAEVRRAVEGMNTEGTPGGYEQADLASDQAKWQSRLDELAQGKIADTRMMYVSRVPGALRLLGLNGGLSVRASKMRKISSDHPELPLSAVERLPGLLAEPRAAFPTGQADGTHIVALDMADKNGDPIIVALKPEQGRDGANVILSFYGKSASERGVSGLEWISSGLRRAIQAGNGVYVDEGSGEATTTGKADAARSSYGPIPFLAPPEAKGLIHSKEDIFKRFGRGLYQSSFNNEARGRIVFDQNRRLIELFQSRNLSTPLHELSHMWLEELRFDAEQPNAPEQLKADWETVKAYFAVAGHKIGDDGQIPTEAHELFARSGERYFMEGKAPSSALVRLFESFRSWLVQIYKTVDNLRAPISPEMRGVFDRMLATDDEIKATEQRQGLQALFKDAASAGMSEDEFNAYQRQVDDARADAHASLIDKTMKDIRRRETERYREARKGVKAEETARIDASPVFKAIATAKEQRLNKGWIEDNMGADTLDLLPVRVPPLYVDGGAHPDVVAEQAGYPSGKDMIEALIGAERAHRQAREGGDKRTMRERAIETATDEEMNRRYGDPLNDGSIEREALAAVHNDMQGEVIASELRVLSRKTGQRPTPYALAKEWARGKIRSGVVAQEASPSAIQRYARNAAKAGREAEAAMLKGDAGETFRQKQFQMLNNALVSEAKQAADEVEAAVKRMDNIARATTRKSVNQEYLEQAQALLEQVDLRKRSQVGIDRQGKWEAWSAARQAEGYDVVVPGSFEATLGQTNWSRLTVENLLALDEAVKQIIHLGRLKQTLTDNQEQREWGDVFREAEDGAGKIKGPPDKGFDDPGFWDSLRNGALSLDAMLLKMETIFDWLDGGNSNGVFNRIAFRPIADAQHRQTAMLKDYFGQTKALFEAIPAETISRWQNRETLPFTDQLGRPVTMPRQKVISMALNIGNEGNLQRLADGYGWNRDAIQTYLNETLTADEWKFVQGVWDTIGSLWPEIEALEKRVNGVAPDKVESRAFDTPHGPMKGGYYPAIYDATRDYKTEEQRGRDTDLFEGTYTRATTRASATKERADQVKRPILLDLGVINRHLGEVIHDITHREAVMQANRFLTNARVLSAVDQALGIPIRKQFRPWLKHIANAWAAERAGNEAFGKFISKMRANVTAVGLGFRATTILVHTSGLAFGSEVVGAKWVAQGLAALAKNPVQTTNHVLEQSAAVREYLEHFDRDIGTQLARLDSSRPINKAKQHVQDAQRFLFHGIGWVVQKVTVPVWLGAYNKALSEGLSDADAKYAADKATRQTMGSAGPKDLAAIQRGTGNWGQVAKLMTMFYTQMAAQYQRQRTLARDVMGRDERRPRDLPRLAARAFFLIGLAPMWDLMFKMAISGKGPDDDESWFEFLTKHWMANELAPLPVVRDLFEPIWNTVSGHHTFAPSITPLQKVYDSLMLSAGDVGRIAHGKETKHATRDTMDTVGYATGLVPDQVAAATQFLVDVSEGDANPQSIHDWVVGLSTGHQPKH